MGKINDFGKVIEGARKDLWKSRGLMVEDTTGMTDLEKEKYVTKDNIWTKPDVNQLLEVFPREIVYWKMEMRKLVAAKPMQITIEEYIEGVRTMKFTFLVIVHTTMMTGDFMMITRLHTRKRTKIRQSPMEKSM